MKAKDLSVFHIGSAWARIARYDSDCSIKKSVSHPRHRDKRQCEKLTIVEDVS